MRMSRRAALQYVCVLAGLLILRPSLAQGQQFSFLALGDWGIDSPDRQQVADAMAAFAQHSPRPYSAALSLGDNFYVPLASADDPRFMELFEKTYDPKRLNFPFYVLLGNHDYQIDGGHPRYEWEMQYALTHPDSRWKLPAKWYRLDLPADHPLVTFLMLNSNKENPVRYSSLTPLEWTEELAWMNQQLASSRAPWTICCAHHTVYSNGTRGDNGVLVQQWGSLFEKYKVDFYLCGHDHTMQHLEPGTFTSYVVSGGGGAKRDPMLRDNRGPFSKGATGFASFSFDPDQATVQLIGGDGTVLHSFVRTKAGVVTITHNTPSEPRTKYPLRAIQGIPMPAATQP